MPLAEVAVNVPLDKTFHYNIPDGMEVLPLQRVKINFAGKNTYGIVLKIVEREDIAEELSLVKTIKDILGVIDKTPVINENTVAIARWMSEYYFAPFGETLFAITPSAPKPKPYLHRYRYIGYLPQLNAEQKACYETIEKHLPAPTPESRFLLYGVTGSGKTEVYKHLVKKALRLGKSTILLIPEIALTPQTLERFYESFGEEVAIYHSKLNNNERLGEWIKALSGRARVIIGPRSAIFTPVQNLGLIIVDEEHETSYKATNSPRYHARQIAMHRAKTENAVLVLGSATPQVETYFYASRIPKERNLFHLVELTKRYSDTAMPDVKIVDMRQHQKQGNVLAEELVKEMLLTLDRKKQVLLFLNRRGFSPVLLCRECGHVFGCPNCNISLTYHKSTHRIECHHCGHAEGIPPSCPSCGGIDIAEMGSGTEKIEQMLQEIFPNRKILRMDLDTTRKKDGYIDILDQLKSGEADILVGTQMVAKGHDIAGIHLVGVILPDIILNIPDFRSSERAFILLTQVIGRAGRRNEKGQAIIQTFVPEQYPIVTAAAQDYSRFFELEIAKRELFYYPPFCRLARVVVRGKDESRLKTFVNQWAIFVRRAVSPQKGTQILGPVTCPIEKLKNNYRYHIIIKSNNIKEISRIISLHREFFIKSKEMKYLYMEIDIDPISIV